MGSADGTEPLVEINNREDLERWQEDRPREDSEATGSGRQRVRKAPRRAKPPSRVGGGIEAVRHPGQIGGERLVIRNFSATGW